MKRACFTKHEIKLVTCKFHHTFTFKFYYNEKEEKALKLIKWLNLH